MAGKHLNICIKHRGSRIDDQAFCEEADGLEWDSVWPVIKDDMTLTGEISTGDDWDMFNYADIAMISTEDAIAGGWIMNVPDEGYATPPIRD